MNRNRNFGNALELRANPMSVSTLIASCFIFATIFILNFPTSPFFTTAQRDSGVYLYGGWAILHHLVPYKDFWDHKPPLIFYFDSFGLWWGGQLGVWVSETLLFAVGVICLYRAMRIKVGRIGAWSSVLFLVLLRNNPHFYQDSNLTESLTLSLNLMGLSFLLLEPDNRIFLFLIGILEGAVFFTKYNCISLIVAIFIFSLLFWIIEKNNDHLKRLFYVFCGFALVIFGFFFLFLSQNNLSYFMDETLFYNRLYASFGPELAGSPDHFQVFWMATLIGIVPMIFSVFLLFWWIWDSKFEFVVTNKIFFTVLFILLPVELFLVILPGRCCGHYFLENFACLSVAFGFVVQAVFERVGSGRVPWLVRLLLLFLAWGIIASNPLEIPKKCFQTINCRLCDMPPITVLLKAYPPSLPLYVWGAQTRLNFLTQRLSPSRYTYFYPLMMPGYGPEKRCEELLNDLEKHPDTLILDAAGKNNQLGDYSALGFFGLPDEKTADIPAEELKKIKDYVDLNYRPVKSFPGWGGGVLWVSKKELLTGINF